MGPVPPTTGSMQSLFVKVRAAAGQSSSGVEDSEDVRKSASFSRFRLLDDEEQRRETEAVERIIRDLKTQRRSKAETSRSKRSNAERWDLRPRPLSADPSRLRRNSIPNATPGTACRPEPSTSPTMKDKQARSRLGRDRSWHQDTRSRPESPMDSPEQPSPVHLISTGSSSSSFQEKVMEELRRLKKAQQRDLAAIESLKLQKEQAEERVRRLALKLQREGSRTSRSSSSQRVTREIVVDEPLDNGLDACSSADDGNNRRSVGDFDANEGGDESPPVWTALIDDDLDDQPPNYVDDASDCEAPVSPLDSTPPPKWSSRGGDSLSNHRSPTPRSTRSRPTTPSRVRGRSRSPSRGRSPSSQRRSRGTSVGRTSIDLSATRRSCAFFDEKERQQLEEEQRQREAAERLARAARAAPPKQLLEHEEAARRRKAQQLRELQREMNAELSKEKRAKARDVPPSTYLSPSMAGDDGATTGIDTEAKRSERIRKRSQELLQTAALPPRMATATATSSDPAEPQRMTIKMKKKLQEAAEEAAERRRRRARPVPNFDRLHRQWDKVLAKTRAKQNGAGSHDEDEGGDTGHGAEERVRARGATVCEEFFVSRADKLEELRGRKEARRLKLVGEEQARQRLEKGKQEKLLARVKRGSAAGSGSKSVATKTERLRVEKLLADAAEAEKRRQRERQEADARDRKLREASRRVAAQVKHSEARRRDEYSGTFVELPTDPVSDKAKESRQQFKEAMKRNRERLLAAVALKPSLMERFATDVKREEHKRAALEAVVSGVFRGDAAAMKGVLTEEERELAQDLTAAKEGGDEQA